MTTPHPEDPAEGADDPAGSEPADDQPSEGGTSIDNDPAEA